MFPNGLVRARIVKSAGCFYFYEVNRVFFVNGVLIEVLSRKSMVCAYICVCSQF